MYFTNHLEAVLKILE